MKRILHISIAVMILLSLFTLSGCCSHEYETEVIREATCAEEGEALYTCTKCGESYTEAIPKTEDHKFVETVIREATCGTDGEAELSCSVCGLKETRPIEKTGNHTYTDEIKTPATCTATGVIVHRCTVCGDANEEEIPLAPHQYQEQITKAATCAAAGSKTVTCKVCGESHSETIPVSNDHQYQEQITKAATCAATGTKTLTCKICGKSRTETIPVTDDHTVGWGKCPVCGRTSTKLIGTAREIKKYAMRGVQDLKDCLDYLNIALNNAPTYNGLTKAMSKFFTRGNFATAASACGNYAEFADIRDYCNQIIKSLDNSSMPTNTVIYNDYRDLTYIKSMIATLKEVGWPLSQLSTILPTWPD